MIRLEYPKFNIEGLRDSEKLSTIKRQLDTLTNNIQLVLESISGDVEALSEFVGNSNEAENSENISTITESITSITESIGELEGRDYIVEQGTSGIWTYRKWNSGIAECWGYTATASIACTSQWGNGYCSALQTVAFPSGLFKASPRSVQLQMWDNGGGYYATLKGWNKDNAQYYIFSPKSETRDCDTNFYVIGKWK